MAKLKKGEFYHVLCRPFDRPRAWRQLIYRGYNRTTGRHKFEPGRITVSPKKLRQRVRQTADLLTSPPPIPSLIRT